MKMNSFCKSLRHPDKLFSGLRLVLIGTVLMVCINASAQFLINGMQPGYDQLTRSFLVTIPQSCWGKDYRAEITLTDSSVWEYATFDNQPILQPVVFRKVNADKQYSISVFMNGKQQSFTLSFTFLPILHLSGEFSNDYTSGEVILQNPHQQPQVMKAVVKWRGGTSNSFDKHKKNYKIQFVDENGVEKDYSFFSLRSDDDWILDAGQVDMFRVRNLIAAKLWNDFATKPYYAVTATEVYTASRGEVVEVFLNDAYQGIYSFCEPIDRKQLNLRKYNEGSLKIHGGLWKATGWGDATFWNIPKSYDNTQPTWGVFELKYPKIKDVCPSDYSTLYNAIKFVRTAANKQFEEEIGDYIDIPVFIDFYLFVNLLNAFDITGKNIYWAVYDKQYHKKITPAMWDIDSSVGQNYTDEPLHPDYVAWNTKPHVPTYIAQRLLKLDVDQFNKKLVNRYIQLRKTYFSLDYLTNTYRHYYELVKQSGAAAREERRWSGDSDIAFLRLNFDQELAYIIDWLEHRLEFLDQYFVDNYQTDIFAAINRRHSISGIQVDQSYKGIVIIKGKKYFVK